MKPLLTCLALLLLMVLSAAARAEDRADWCKMHGIGCDDGTRVYAWRKWERPKPDYRIEVRRKAAIERERDRERERERRLRREDIREGRLEDRVVCVQPRRAIGEEHVSRDGAEAAADRAWEASVSYDHGRKYMDLGNARHITHTCSRSRPSKDGVVGRAADAVGAFYLVCATEAQPCSAAAQIDDGK